MTDKSEPKKPDGDDADQTLYAQFKIMWRAFRASPTRNRILTLGAAMFVVIAATAFGQVLLNRWNRPFYDAIEHRNFDAFVQELGVFALIAVGLLAVNIGQTWLNAMIRLKLREGLTLDLVGQWMQPRRAFRLANAGAIGVNPDQRMHEDAAHLTDLTTELGVGLLQASILLASFVSVLWSLSSGFVFHVAGRSFAIPGYMVWAAILYAGSASWLSWFVARPLIALNGARYAREAELRFSLMRVNEHIDAISLTGGEADEKRKLELDLASVIRALRRIIRAQINLAWVTDSYGWFTLVAPILVAAPVYFSGSLSFGGLMMAVGAFNQVQSSLRWFITNIGAIADWRATLLRISAFRSAITKTDVLHAVERRIEFVEGDSDRMIFDKLEVSSPRGCTRLSEEHAKIAPGDRVLITGDPHAGKTLFFRAIAGLWPWGAGSISMPRGETITYVPLSPYLPPGTLRTVLSYPSGDGAFKDVDLVSALGKVGLSRLAPQLDRDARWDRDLTLDEQRALAFARLGLQKPRWVVIDEGLDVMEAETRRRAVEIIEGDLKDAAIVHIGRAEPHSRLFTRTLHLAQDRNGPKLNASALRSVAPHHAEAAVAAVLRASR